MIIIYVHTNYNVLYCRTRGLQRRFLVFICKKHVPHCDKKKTWLIAHLKLVQTHRCVDFEVWSLCSGVTYGMEIRLQIDLHTYCHTVQQSIESITTTTTTCSVFAICWCCSTLEKSQRSLSRRRSPHRPQANT